MLVFWNGKSAFGQTKEGNSLRTYRLGNHRGVSSMTALFLGSLFMSLVLSSPTHGQNSENSRLSLQGLSSVVVYVDSLTTEMEEEGVTQFMLHSHIVRRLKDAGMEVLNTNAGVEIPETAPMLYVNVTATIDKHVDFVAYGIRVELTQGVRLERDPETAVFYVPTWSTGGVGVLTKRWQEALLEDVLEYTDEFVEALVEANPVD